MKDLAKLTGAIALCIYTSHAQAWELPTMRMTCIPDSGYFQVEYVTLGMHTVYGDTDPESKKGIRLLKAWQKHGYYAPGKFEYTCALSASRNVIRAYRDRYAQSGMCGESPPIYISLFRNGLPILDKIPIGDGYACKLPALTRLEVKHDRLAGADIRLSIIALEGVAKYVELERRFRAIEISGRRGRPGMSVPIDEEKLYDIAASAK